LVQLLHNHGAHLHTSASDGLTALHRAAQCGNEKLVRYFIDSGADVCAKTTSGMTALHYASEITLPANEVIATSIIGMLLEHGAELDAMNQQGKTPLLNSVANVTYASEFQFSPTVCNLLLEKGAEKTLSNAEGKTMVEIVNDSHSWIFGEEGHVVSREEPQEFARLLSPSRGRGRGRGAWRRGE
jgi:ankyrin repeat protein